MLKYTKISFRAIQGNSQEAPWTLSSNLFLLAIGRGILDWNHSRCMCVSFDDANTYDAFCLKIRLKLGRLFSETKT